jgi:4-aminobutyrate aminotransferase-like enzyme
MEYFNTFGGNPVSCAVALAVLDVIEEEGLQARAAEVGAHLKSSLMSLAKRRPMIGDVRGLGLFLGIELVREAESLTPATRQAAEAVELMKDRGVLLSTDGPFENVIKIKPPLVFSRENADELVAGLDEVLGEIEQEAEM